MTTKGTKKLNKEIKKALAPLNVRKAKLDTEWSYDFNTDTLYYALTQDITDVWFNDFLKDKFHFVANETGEDIFLISVLHEIGHRETIDNISDKVYNKCLEEKCDIAEALENSDTDEQSKKIEYRYFSLPVEIQATEWGVKYAKKHKKKVAKMHKAVAEAIEKYYKKNNVE